jgi:tetratricopeptide (TPR) repeat protein
MWRSGDTLRVSAELISGKSGFTRWSRTFDSSVNDLLKVQHEIALAVADALSRELGMNLQGVPRPQGQVGATGSVAAFEAYLRGKDLLQRAAGEDVNRAAVTAFDNALVIDPDFGAAHAARARALTALGNQYLQGAERLQAYDEAIRAANTAIRVAPDLADAWSSLGYALFSGRLDVQGARDPYDRSRQLGGGDADVLNRYALFKARTGRFEEAREAIERAASLDPMNARIYRSVGGVAYAARRYADSIPPLQRSLNMNPDLNGGWAALGSSQLLLGQVAQARKSFESERSSLFGPVGIAIIAHREGRLEDARRALDEMIGKNGDNSLYQQAQVYAQWGEHAKAIDALNKARASRDSGLGLMLNDPLLDPVRKDPEFTRLLKELGFT